MSTSAGGSARLSHLTGARCLASAWIVCGHFIYVEKPSAFTAARHRGNAAVDFFIVLSGFMTQWAYGPRMGKGGGTEEIRTFYLRRVGRVVLTTWVAMMLGMAVVLVQAHGAPLDYWHILRCFCFVETWRDPTDWCPDGQTWTVAALIPSWLLYPLMRKAATGVEDVAGGVGLATLLLLLYGVSSGPLLAQLIQHGSVSYRQGFWSQTWPPATMPDFAIGVVAALAAQRHHDWGSRWRWLLADVALLGAVALCLFIPSSGYREGWEPLFNHSLAIAFAAFLYGSSAGGGSCITAQLLGHEALVALGEYSFEVYLFQYPVHEIFVALGDVSGMFSMKVAGNNANYEGFMAFFLGLWLVSGLYAEFVEAPLIGWLRVKAGSGVLPA
ncbi:unnamed protein product [Polarella glacialis]|uniref:Acyltransferase 3 domain-containing protein n=1 Tax=Polarella glacialis TaxID=89957 RepID=A0A813D991_POLGL|nr:unnamed protein product [Polarella glacialis]